MSTISRAAPLSEQENQFLWDLEGEYVVVQYTDHNGELSMWSYFGKDPGMAVRVRGFFSPQIVVVEERGFEDVVLNTIPLLAVVAIRVGRSYGDPGEENSTPAVCWLRCGSELVRFSR